MVSYHTLAPVCKAFGIDLPIQEKREILGLSKKEENKRRSFKIIDRSQMKLDDFHPENKSVREEKPSISQKIHIISYDSLLKDNDVEK